MSPLLRASLGFLAIAALLAPFGDFEVWTIDPWGELGRMLLGIATPDFFATEYLGSALINTLAFAFVGVALGCGCGFLLALAFHFSVVRGFCAFIRAVHELFWALIFLQVFGLTATTGVLAIAIPYAGTFAKVFSEILEEADPTPLKAAPAGTGRISLLLFVRLPDVWAQFCTYTLYRLECGLRSSAVIGFVGLPTLGFHLESAFSQGDYSQVAALLFLFYVIIAAIRLWVRQAIVPIYVALSLAVLPWGDMLAASNMWRFFGHDILPQPIRAAGSFAATDPAALWNWASDLFATQAWPGMVNTAILTQVALVVTGAMTLAMFPLVSPKFLGRAGRTLGHIALVVIRSTPEYVLASIFLLLWGPSMLPAVAALALHNGAIIGHLIGRHTETLVLRPDPMRSVDRYFYDVLPRVYPPFLAFLFYRWEVIMRETAILGMLGIATLGFYVDSAFAALRFDRALFLILVSAALNIAIDMTSRAVRARLRLRMRPDMA